MRVLAETDAAHAELAVIRARAAADFAAVVRRTLNFGVRFDFSISEVLAIIGRLR